MAHAASQARRPDFHPGAAPTHRSRSWPPPTAVRAHPCHLWHAGRTGHGRYEDGGLDAPWSSRRRRPGPCRGVVHLNSAARPAGGAAATQQRRFRFEPVHGRQRAPTCTGASPRTARARALATRPAGRAAYRAPSPARTAEGPAYPRTVAVAAGRYARRGTPQAHTQAWGEGERPRPARTAPRRAS